MCWWLRVFPVSRIQFFVELSCAWHKAFVSASEVLSGRELLNILHVTVDGICGEKVSIMFAGFELLRKTVSLKSLNFVTVPLKLF